MLFTPLAALLLLLVLPLAICILDGIFRIVFDSLLPRVPFELVLTLIVGLGIAGMYTAGGLLFGRLGREIAGMFDQVLRIL